MSRDPEPSRRYHFGDGTGAGVLLGMSMRQAAPLVLGVVWLTLGFMVGLVVIGMIGPVLGAIASFGRWKRAPLHEVAIPGATLLSDRLRGRDTWTRRSLLSAGEAPVPGELPKPMLGLELLEESIAWAPGDRFAAVVLDQRAGTVSMVLRVEGAGFPVASPAEQDGYVASWGSALAPLARAHSPIARMTWQDWAHPAGVADHRRFLASVSSTSSHGAASDDYEQLLLEQAPFSIEHEVLLTLTVELRRVRKRRGADHRRTAIDALVDETKQFCLRLESAGFVAGAPLSCSDLSSSLRRRCDPLRDERVPVDRQSLATAAGMAGVEWGPMAVSSDWFDIRVDGCAHRSYRIATWPMLPVGADWMGPLLTLDDTTKTVTVVLEPVPLGQAAQDANRQMTSLEADQMQKERHGFRLTARERRRHDDVETRERELAEGHPLFRHVGLVTVSARDLEALEDAAARVEQAAAQSLLDLRPLAGRQGDGWVASLPLGRSVRKGGWR
ncbi:SCO6880 family protein [Ilumatobacter nonamiensis]|uniref:SCO6880 family protein n=1 Tax=Ilumatobacter nonamiensis TaxID=467093 RepID=UPI000345705B|nr:SCO6880 family protein [Ilumatobacter nonamiensis]